VAVLSTLRLGGVLVAGHVGMVHDGRFSYWVPAYDPAWSKDGVGAILLEWMIEQCHRQGLREFDFLLGNETYKWSYATHTRLVGPVGTKPLAAQLWEPLRAQVMATVRQHPEAYRYLQGAKRQVATWSLELQGR
jgi:CelD/BcsL family acetyltransferase involved in cellulose biosynthesis